MQSSDRQTDRHLTGRIQSQTIDFLPDCEMTIKNASGEAKGGDTGGGARDPTWRNEHESNSYRLTPGTSPRSGLTVVVDRSFDGLDGNRTKTSRHGDQKPYENAGLPTRQRLPEFSTAANSF
jgi:hypothetical protein